MNAPLGLVVEGCEDEDDEEDETTDAGARRTLMPRPSTNQHRGLLKVTHVFLFTFLGHVTLCFC